jgi:hypothetical protein
MKRNILGIALFLAVS